MAKMPKYEKIRNALSRKSSEAGGNSWLGFFNSPFGLWILSALLLTIGGAALSGRRECVVTARSDIERFQHLSREIFERRARLLTDVVNSSNAADFEKLAKSNAFADFKEFDGQSISSLVDQQDGIRPRIKFTPGSEATIAENRRQLGKSNTIESFLGGGAAAVYSVSDDDLVDFKSRIKPEMLLRYLVILTQETHTSLSPDCSIWRLATDLFTTDEKNIVQGSAYKLGHP